MLDALCWRHYGRESAVREVLEANPDLADYGPVLPSGVKIELPELSAPVADQAVSLWD
tara:strand:+ start:115 stop:288 length:174 start_codon:yes stop_codon:yes gene_type:complete